jgi:hypothetical protein
VSGGIPTIAVLESAAAAAALADVTAASARPVYSGMGRLPPMAALAFARAYRI